MTQPNFRVPGVTGKEHLSLKLAELFSPRTEEGGYTSINNLCEKSMCFCVAASYPPQFPQLFRFTSGRNDFCMFRERSSAPVQSSPCLVYLQGLSQGSLDLKT